MALRPLTPADAPSAMRLSIQAGWNQVEADWLRLLTLWPDGCFAGTIDGQIVATTTIARYGESLAWIGMVLVDRALRGRGLGGVLFDHAMAQLPARPEMAIGLDASDLGRPMYLKRGFVDVSPAVRYVRSGDARATLTDDLTTPLAPEDWPAIAALDREIFGGDRTTLLRSLSREQGVRGRVLRSGGVVHGFGFIRPGRTAEQIGPLVARSWDSAEALVQALTHEAAGDVILDSIRGASDEAWLQRLGFVPTRRLTRMFYRMASAPFASHPWIIAAGGFELG